MSASIKIQSVTFVRYKQLKGGKMIARSIRTLTTGFKTTVSGDGPGKMLLVEFDGKFASGTMMGTFDTSKGQLLMSSDNCKPEGYLKRKYFQVAGYVPQVNITNVNKRPRLFKDPDTHPISEATVESSPFDPRSITYL